MAINYDELAKALSDMKPRQRLYEIVKAEMVKRGRWKERPHGTPFKKGHDPRRAVFKPVDKSQTEYIRNGQNMVVMMTGLLPDGSYGQIADSEKPFTEDELTNAEAFKRHKADLDKRIGI